VRTTNTKAGLDAERRANRQHGLVAERVPARVSWAKRENAHFNGMTVDVSHDFSGGR
jgi:hypothetical protein